MSFGGFKFGSGSNSAPSSSTIPQFSLTAPTPTVQPASSFSFGSATQPQTNQAGQQQQGAGAAPAPAQGSSLFGGFGQTQNQGQNQAQGQQPQGQQQQQGQQPGGFFGGGASSLFGAKPAVPQNTPATGGSSLFGGGSSLFGTQNQQQPQQQNQQPSTSLFGQSTNQQPQQSSLFGQSTSQPQQSSLFGRSTTQPQQSTGLFGSTAQAPKPSGALFQSTSQPQSSLFASQNQTQQLGQSTSGSSSGLGKTTRFTDLPEPAQRAIEQLDAFFKQQKEAGKGINSEPLGQAIKQTSLDVKAATEESSALTQGLASLQTSLKQLKDKFDAEETDLRKVAEIWETYRSIDGRPGAVRVAAHRDFPHEFFARTAASMQERAVRYRKTIAQLQRVVVSLTSTQDAASQHAVAQTIQNHQNAILSLAAQLEQLQIRMNHLRGIFTGDYQERTNSLRDPFEVAREEKGVAPLRA